MWSDPIADMLTRIRNAVRVHKSTVSIPNSKVKRTDSRAEACLEEYVRLTRKEGKRRNKSFEKKYAPTLAPYLERYARKRDLEVSGGVWKTPSDECRLTGLGH